MPKPVFKKYGDSYQLRIQDATELASIQSLNEAHWAATSVPTRGLNCDPTFLSYVDTDHNGRIRTQELKEAQTWLFHRLAHRERVSEASSVLRLGDIDTRHPEGQQLKTAAELVLRNLGHSGAQEITLEQVRDLKTIQANAASNGDGIIPLEATDDADVAQFITAVMDTVGFSLDATGKRGIGKQELEAFVAEGAAYLAWKAGGDIPEGQQRTEILPYGDDTPGLFQLITNVEEKLEQYFLQCAMVHFDPRAATEMQLRQKELEELDFSNPSIMQSRIQNAPLALPTPEMVLDLDGKVNRLYAASVSELDRKVFTRVLGARVKKLTQHQWETVKNVFAPYRAWQAGKQGAAVEKLGIEGLRKYLNDTYRERVNELIEKDLGVANEINQIGNLEKVILYQRWMLELANNVVSLAHLYDPTRRALFEAGTLIIDGRKMTFSMRIENLQAHKMVSEKSAMYLLYLKVTGGENHDGQFQIVAPVTSGTAGGLHIGKRGVFFSTDGKEWDAEVVDVVVNPISMWESAIRPFQQVAGFVRAQVEKFTKSGEATIDTGLASTKPSGIGRDLLLAGGVAIAALGSAFAYITQALSQVAVRHVLGVALGMVVLLFLPGFIMGLIKIRKRNMSVLLEASGWAVNVRMRMSAALGRLFTHVPPLPKGAKREGRDMIETFSKQRGDGPARWVWLALVLLFALVLVVVFRVYGI